MLKVTAEWVTVFQPVVKDKVVTAVLSTSKVSKNENGEIKYFNMTWNARFVGEAAKKAALLAEKEKIHLTNACCENWYNKEKQQLNVVVTVFDFEKAQ